MAVVGLVFSRAESAAPASFVGFIEDHSSVPTLEEVSALFRIMEDQSRRDDGDAEGAARDVLGTPGFDDVRSGGTYTLTADSSVFVSLIWPFVDASSILMNSFPTSFRRSAKSSSGRRPSWMNIRTMRWSRPTSTESSVRHSSRLKITLRLPLPRFVVDSDRAAPHGVAIDDLQFFRVVKNGAQVCDSFVEERMARAASD